MLHIGAMLKDSAKEVIEHSATVVIGNANPTFHELLPRIPPEKSVIDLVRRTPTLDDVNDRHQGIGW
jgi:hypothetical protein